jgi:Fe2+ transport system protein FeoA
MTLDQAGAGFEGTIKGIEGDPVVVERLREIGCLTGETIRVIYRMVFGEPLVVEIRGTSVAMRNAEARCIRV